MPYTNKPQVIDGRKLCPKCHQTKPVAEFARKSQNKSGLDSYCRPCKAERTAAHRSRQEVQERERKARTEWYYEKGGKEIVRKNARLFRDRTGYPGWSDPIAHRARNLTQAAIRRGKIARGLCEACGGAETHGHHDDYTRPLEIRWLCGPCHRAWHQKNEPIRGMKDRP